MILADYPLERGWDIYDGMNTNSNRRQFLKIGALTGSGLLLSTGMTRAFAAACGLTPPQTPGPFYPGEALFHQDNDLTALPGDLIRAAGQVIYVQGKILDAGCAPIAGATVEIW